MEDQSTNISCSGGFISLLTVAFIVLKLVGVISWSWVWVLAPMWISIGLGLIIFLIVLIISNIQ